ncbi:MAG: hypothetical protein ACR2MO_06455 [Acidimicrobiales bacterium]
MRLTVKPRFWSAPAIRAATPTATMYAAAVRIGRSQALIDTTVTPQHDTTRAADQYPSPRPPRTTMPR